MSDMRWNHHGVAATSIATYSLDTRLLDSRCWGESAPVLPAKLACLFLIIRNYELPFGLEPMPPTFSPVHLVSILKCSRSIHESVKAYNLLLAGPRVDKPSRELFQILD